MSRLPDTGERWLGLGMRWLRARQRGRRGIGGSWRHLEPIG